MNDPVEIGLWVWTLDVGAAERIRLATLLSSDEQARAARFVFDRDRERYIVGRGRLREVLARELGGDGAGLTFSYTEHGKPFLDGAALRFNLSHSEGVAALAVAHDVDLGVDVEFVRPLKEDIAARYFSRAEMAALAKLADGDQLEGFYRCWTRKEAVVKAIGEGLSRALDSFDVTVAKNAPASIERLEGDEARHWKLEHFTSAAGFVGAIACRTAGAPVRVTRREF